MQQKPLSYAPITFVEGEQGSGKSNTAVARAVDATFENITSVILPNKTLIRADPVLPATPGVAKLYLPNREPVIGKLPVGSVAVADEIRVYANFHIYGIRYMYMPLSMLLEYLNTGLIKDGYLLVDEAYIGGDAWDGMTALVRVIAKLTNQIRKRHLRLYLMYPHGRMSGWRNRWSRTEHIQCSYNEKTREITLLIKKRGQRTRTITYYAPMYWAYYNTDEQFAIPEGEIARAIAKVS